MKKWILIIGLIVVGLVVVVAGGGYLWFQHTLKKSLPQTSGEVALKGLKEDVEIIRDTYGVPTFTPKMSPIFTSRSAMPWPRIASGKWNSSAAWGTVGSQRYSARISSRPIAISGCSRLRV